MDTGGMATTTAGPTKIAAAQARGVLRVQDYERAKRFYTEKLGLEVTDSTGPMRGGTVSAGKGSAFDVYERPGMPAPQNTAMSFDVDDVEQAVTELRNRGVTFEEYDMPELGIQTVNGIASAGSEKIAWFKDTEGNIFAVGCLCG